MVTESQRMSQLNASLEYLVSGYLEGHASNHLFLTVLITQLQAPEAPHEPVQSELFLKRDNWCI